VWGEPIAAVDTVYLQATTACFTAIVLMQVVNVYLCRRPRQSLFVRPVLANRLITTGIVAELVLVLLITYTPPGQALFGTAPIGVEVWLSVIPFALAMVLAEEIRKGIVRRREQRPLLPVTQPVTTP
jgi:magnesium-transporting ATPase (P-type)